MSQAEQLAGKVALITGASRGIGAASAIALADAGCNVAINYLRSREEAESVAAEVRSRGAHACVVQADVSQPDEVNRLVAAVEQELNPTKPLAELTLADWTETISANLTSAFLVSQAVLPGMRRRQWGRLIFLSSVAAQTGGVVGPHYAASKAGMLGLMHSYSSLLAREGITSNAIAPALIETDMIRNNKSIRPDLLPIGRFGQADEVARAVVLLATTGYITGQAINLNGGWYPS
jgi:3-oxoacyl-[acyl-carrier protein] reductase